MPSIFITFRGEPDVEVEIDRDYGYEPDTGAHDIEWHFADDKFVDVVCTDAEEQEIFEACARAGMDTNEADYVDFND